MTEPIRIAFDVDCARETAWEVWTTRIAQWWPADHTVSGEADLEVVLETEVGGRIYERARDGSEHDWGRVTVWEPPERLVYEWHLGASSAEATEVEITFEASAADATHVRIEHRGWERLGADGEVRRGRNLGGWRTLLPHYTAEAGGGSPPTFESAAPQGEAER